MKCTYNYIHKAFPLFQLPIGERALCVDIAGESGSGELRDGEHECLQSPAHPACPPTPPRCLALGGHEGISTVILLVHVHTWFRLFFTTFFIVVTGKSTLIFFVRLINV